MTSNILNYVCSANDIHITEEEDGFYRYLFALCFLGFALKFYILKY
uniref:Uncharacterized protein n=1 Tax=Bartonella schoenbuchensis (strain DSM 13525 / NCTC 13165 / R1) TaxID=687861 RepID=E6Z0G4_BARSR|nr:hypothetical protein B11C_40457 [Bartonella schoenbuchensis R1]